MPSEGTKVLEFNQYQKSESGIDKTFLKAKDPRDSAGLKYFHDLQAFIEYSNDMDDIYKKY